MISSMSTTENEFDAASRNPNDARQRKAAVKKLMFARQEGAATLPVAEHIKNIQPGVGSR